MNTFDIQYAREHVNVFLFVLFLAVSIKNCKLGSLLKVWHLDLPQICKCIEIYIILYTSHGSFSLSCCANLSVAHVTGSLMPSLSRVMVSRLPWWKAGSGALSDGDLLKPLRPGLTPGDEQTATQRGVGSLPARGHSLHSHGGREDFEPSQVHCCRPVSMTEVTDSL